MMLLGMVTLPRTRVVQCESTLKGLASRRETKLNMGNGEIVAVVTMSSIFLVSLSLKPERAKTHADCHSHHQHHTHPYRETMRTHNRRINTY